MLARQIWRLQLIQAVTDKAGFMTDFPTAMAQYWIEGIQNANTPPSQYCKQQQQQQINLQINYWTNYGCNKHQNEKYDLFLAT